MADMKMYQDVMEKCSHCSYCEATCPVFLEDLLETHVARARMELIRAALVDETLPVSDRFKEIVDRCLLCTNCKQTCPADVPVDDIVITARHLIYDGKRMGMIKRKLLKQVMEDRGIKGAMGKLGNIAKIAGVKNLPEIPEKSFDDMYSPGSYSPDKEVKAKAVYFAGCATNTIYPETGDAVMQVLKRNGIEVVVPEGLNCCGIPALAEGDIDTFKKFAKNNTEILSDIDADVILTDCTSCAMIFKEKLRAFVNEEGLNEKIASVSEKVREVTDYLVSTGLSEVKSNEKKVTYHVPCHRGWDENVSDAPRKLLSMIPKLTYAPMEYPENCCGAGGAFFMENKELSSSIRDKKTEDILNTKAEILVTQCPSCRSYLKEGLKGKDVEIMHPVSLLK